jgi:nicotinamide-nucleotide amidase
MTDAQLYVLAEKVGMALKAQGLMIATAESCTGGWIAEAITAVAGSSAWFERGFVVYTYISKREMLGVSTDTLAQYGAVSEETVREMAQGAITRSHAQVAVAVSGTAGPSGGTPQKPVGTVCLAWAGPAGDVASETNLYAGNRDSVRRQAVARALEGVLARVQPPATGVA